jgi:HEAT repeat protein
LRSLQRTRTAASFPGPRLSSSRLLCAALALGFLAPFAGAQESRPEKTPEQVAEALLGPSPTVRKQALQWAKAHQAEVVPALLKLLTERPAASFAFEGIRALGEINDPRLSGALVELCNKPAFPWVPQALEALADHAFPGAVPLFVNRIEGPSARGRAACCRGIAALGISEMDPILAEALGDEEASVRVEAARALIRLRGDHCGVPVVVRDLSLDRRFATFDPGAEARAGAAAFLKEFGLPPAADPVPIATEADLKATLATLRSKMGEVGKQLPETLAPHEPDVPASFRWAVEARSCPEGDFFLRVDDGNRVVFGRDMLRWFTVDPKLLARVRKGLDAIDTGGKDRKILGPVNCDFERLAVREGTAWRTLVIGNGRREASLDDLEAAILEVVRKTRGEQEAARHARRVTPFGIASRPASRPDSR